MSLTLSTNINSLSAQRSATKINNDIQTTTQRLASGDRLIRPADDAASLSISEKTKARLRSEGQSTRNANDAISMMQTIEGSLANVGEMAIKMKELSVQAATDSLTVKDKELVDRQFQSLKSEIQRVISTSRINTKNAVSGTSEILQSQIVDRVPDVFEFKVSGAASSDNSVIRFYPTKLMLSNGDFNLTNLSVGSTQAARESLEEMDNVIGKISYSRAQLGALQSQLNSSVLVGENTSENMTSSYSSLRDADYAVESAANMKNKLLSEANTSVLAQANSSQQALLKLI